MTINIFIPIAKLMMVYTINTQKFSDHTPLKTLNFFNNELHSLFHIHAPMIFYLSYCLVSKKLNKRKKVYMTPDILDQFRDNFVRSLVL